MCRIPGIVDRTYFGAVCGCGIVIGARGCADVHIDIEGDGQRAAGINIPGSPIQGSIADAGIRRAGSCGVDFHHAAAGVSEAGGKRIGYGYVGDRSGPDVFQNDGIGGCIADGHRWCAGVLIDRKRSEKDEGIVGGRENLCTAQASANGLRDILAVAARRGRWRIIRFGIEGEREGIAAPHVDVQIPCQNLASDTGIRRGTTVDLRAAGNVQPTVGQRIDHVHVVHGIIRSFDDDRESTHFSGGVCEHGRISTFIEREYHVDPLFGQRKRGVTQVHVRIADRCRIRVLSPGYGDWSRSPEVHTGIVVIAIENLL